MKKVLSDELRRDLRKILNEVERDGEHFTVGRWDETVAALVPIGWYQEARKALGMPEENGEQGS